MAKTIDDLILEISSLINVLNNKNSGSGVSGYNTGSPAANSGSVDDVFNALNNSLINYKNRIESLSKTHKNYEDVLNNGELKDKIDKFINEINIINSELPKGVTKLKHSNSFFDKYIKEIDKQNNIIADINSKKFNLSVLESKLITEKLEQDRLEIDARKKTIKSEIEIEKSKTKARKKLLKEEIEILTERNKFLAKPKVSLYNENKKQSAKIKEMAEARGVSWSINKKGKETSFSELAKGLSNILSAPRIALKTQSVGRLAANGIAGGAKIAANAAKTIQGGKMDVSGMMSGLSDGLSKMGPYGQAAGALVDILKVCFEEFSKVDKAASDYARSVGGGHAAQVKMRSSAADLAAEMSNLGQRAYEADKILERMGSASEVMGRNLEYLSTVDIRSLQDLKDFGIGDDVISQFDTFGVSVHNVSKQIADLYGESGKRGLNAKATIKAFTSNLKMAQNYTFARGQKALMDMAMKSAQLKFNLRDAEQFANKVSTLEGAMTAGAQLSVLGGSFAMQGNPLAMMYNGLNDVEGLQNQMLAMTKGMARWDSSKGQLDITAFDRERLKAMSQATGIDYTELTTQAMNQARVDRVTQQLGSGFSKEQEEYIKNIASLDENGRAYVQMDNEKFTIEQLKNRPDLLSRLEDESKKKDIEKGSDLGKILNDTRNIQDKLDDFIKFFKSQFTKYIVSIAAKVTGRDENALMYGLEGQSLKDYNATKKLLDDKNLSTKKIQKAIDNGELSQDAIERLRGEGIINQNNEYIGRRGDSRYNNRKSYAWSEIAKLWAPEKTQNKAKGGFVSGEGGPTEDAIPARLSNGEFVINSEATTRHRPLLERINRETNNSSKSTVGFNKGGYINTDSNTIGGTIHNSEFTVNSNAITHHMLLLERINHEIDNIYNLMKTKSKIGFNETKFRNSSGLGGDVIRGVNNSGNLMRPESKIGFNKGKIRNSSSRLRGDTIPTRLSNGGFEVIERYRPLSERINRNINNGGNLMRPESIIGFNEGKFRNDGRLTRDFSPATTRLSENEFAVNIEETTRHRPLSERINRGVKNGDNLMRHESIIGLNKGEDRIGGVGNQKIDVSPIKIEFGTLELKIGDLSRVLDSNEVASRLLNNSTFVDNIVKEIGIRSNFGYRKDDSSNKFLDSPFVRSF